MFKRGCVGFLQTGAVQAHLGRLLVAVVMFIGVGCTTTPTRNPVPLELTNEAGVPGVPDARFWGDEWPEFSLRKFNALTENDFEHDFESVYDQPHSYLAVSGGGANGAFGAGLLVGWTQTGTRPEFTMVTGISTGALTAPFAFLGSDYDDQLKKVYTTTSTTMKPPVSTMASSTRRSLSRVAPSADGW